jgi:RimJ/RimL family protein N-acetyltransferase
MTGNDLGNGALIGQLFVVLTSDQRRKGYATIAIRSLVDWVFQRFPQMPEVWGDCQTNDPASLALANTLGMKDCGLMSVVTRSTLARKFSLTRPDAAQFGGAH